MRSWRSAAVGPRRVWSDRAGRPDAALARGRGADRADPADRRRPSWLRRRPRPRRPAAFPREAFRLLGAQRPAVAAVPGGARRRRPALRDLPAGAGGAGLGLDERGGRASRCTACPATRSAEFGTPDQRAALLPGLLAGDLLGRLLPVRGPGRLGRVGHRDQGHARRRRLAAVRHARPGSPTAGRPTSTRSSPAPATTRPAGCPASWSTPAPTGCRSARRSARWG